MKLPNLDSLVPSDVTPRLGELARISREAVTGFDEYKDLAATLDAVWEVIYPLLVRVDMLKINPVVHHLVVFLFSLEAGASAGCTAQSKPLEAHSMRLLLTLAQVHDSSAELKITQQQVDALTKRDPAAGALLGIRRQMGRWRHLAESMSNAIELLSLANHILHRSEYDHKAAERIALDCSCHDYPSLGRPLPDDKQSLLPLFTECDALWMISHPHGPRADLWRDDVDPNPENLLNQIQSNVRGIARRCYLTKQQPKTCEELTRLPTTRAIASRHLDLWAKELKVDVGQFFLPPLTSKETK